LKVPVLNRKTCVICNPASGRGRALKRLERLRAYLGGDADFLASNGPGHAEELARTAAEASYEVVGAAGGDGTVHEVVNGLLQAKRPDVAMAIYPIGSANDYAYSLNLDADWWLHSEDVREGQPVDAGLVRLGNGTERYFINGMGIGFNGAVTLESSNVRWLQGVPLYTTALLRALWRHYASPRMIFHFDDQVRDGPTLAVSVAIGKREGNFLLAPEAKVDDGLFDFLHAARMPAWELLRYVPGMIFGRIPVNHPALLVGRCRRVSLQSEAPLVAHLDGEMLCRPEEQVTSLDAMLLPAALKVIH
jgi:diacylglycerol kinase (ATP)